MKRAIDQLFYNLTPVQLLTVLSMGEDRGDGKDGELAVMWVVKNRTIHGGWFLDNDILMAGYSKYHAAGLRNVFVASKSRFIYQFDCFMDTDPNRTFCIDAAQGIANLDTSLAQSVIDGTIPDPTKGATYYFAPNPKVADPGWSKTFIYCATIGHQKFYRESV